MADKQHIEWFKQGVEFWNNLRLTNDFEPDFRDNGSNRDILTLFVDKDLTGINLSKANLTKTNLSNTNFTNSDLTRATFSGALLTSTNFTGADLTDSFHLGTSLKGTNFQQSILKDAKLGYSSYSAVDLQDAQAWNANFDFYYPSSQQKDISKKCVTRVSDLLHIIEDINSTETLYFRGEPGIYPKLEPSLMRKRKTARVY